MNPRGSCCGGDDAPAGQRRYGVLWPSPEVVLMDVPERVITHGAEA